MNELYCYGCGIALQTTNEAEIGYVPQKIIDGGRDPLCQRCFQLTNYGRTDKAVININHDEISRDINNDKALVVYVIDLLNITYSMIKELILSVSNRKVLLVANKFDLLPQKIDESKIKEYLKDVAREYELKFADVFVCSASTNYSIKQLMEKIMEMRKGKNVYFIGAANVGKSSIINALLKNYSNDTSHYISVSRYPGTTLSKIEIPLDEVSYLYDTPGFINPRSMACWVEAKDMLALLPKTKIKAQVWQIDSPQVFFFGSLARLDYLQKGKASIITYFPPGINIHRTKLSNAQKIASSMFQKLLPASPQIKTMDDLIPVHLSLSVIDKIDLLISGFGTITVVGTGNHDITIYTPPGVEVTTMESFI